jgi:MYXO-CTERM domain-containing protein
MATFAVDGATAGNAGLTTGSAATFLYCGALPVTTIATHPAPHTNVTTGNFTFTNTANPVTYACKLDTPAGAGTWAACDTGDPSNPAFTTGTLTDGTYTLSVRGTDTYSNVENPPATFTWNVDTVPPVTTIATHPTDPSNSSTGSFTFTNSETPVTYACKLDTPAGAGTWAACTTGNPSTPAYTTGTLSDGSYTLSVLSTDQAGNVETAPVSFPWVVQANSTSLDGGFLDGGAVDSGGEEAAPVLLDAEGVDVFAPADLISAPDVPSNNTPDVAVVVGDDTAPVVSVDAGVDVEGADLLLFIDVGAPRDTKVLDTVIASVDVPTDTLPSGAEPTPDVAPAAPEPNPDTAVVVVKEDAAQPTANKDAAPAAEDFKIMGSGFCAIASSRSTTPAPFMALGLAALALLLRRRKS